MLNTFMTLLTGAVAGGMATVLVRVIRREDAVDRAQVRAWDKESIPSSAPTLMPRPEPITDPTLHPVGWTDLDPAGDAGGRSPVTAPQVRVGDYLRIEYDGVGVCEVSEGTVVRVVPGDCDGEWCVHLGTEIVYVERFIGPAATPDQQVVLHRRVCGPLAAQAGSAVAR